MPRARPHWPVQRQGCSGGACHAQMCIKGTILRHGSEVQERGYLRAEVERWGSVIRSAKVTVE